MFSASGHWYLSGWCHKAVGERLFRVDRVVSVRPTDEPFERALAVLKAQGATLVEIKKFDEKDMGENEFKVLLMELKTGLADYLKSSPAPLTVRTLADVIEFNKTHAAQEMSLFGQDIFEKAEATKGTADPGYKKARARSLQLAGKQGIDRLLKEHKLDALVGPTMPPAWKIDAVHGDMTPGGRVR